MSNNLTNTQVLVIGGSSGIGLATAVAAGKAGASVTIASRSKAKLDTALGSIRGTSRAVVLDTRNQSALERFLIAEAPWDHVVVSAAQTATGPVRIMSLADARAAMESKFWCYYRASRPAKI